MLAPPTPPPMITQRASVRTPRLVEQPLEVRTVELGHRALVLLQPPGPEVEVDLRHAVLDRRPQRPAVLGHQAPEPRAGDLVAQPASVVGGDERLELGQG